MLSIKNLTKQYIYGDESDLKILNAIDDISLEFLDTGLVFITGRSGSGKSTLLNQIGTLDKPTSGEIIFNGLKLTDLNERKASKFRNDHIGFVFQDFALVESMSVYDNIAISLEVQKKDDDKYIDSTLKELDIYDLKDKKVTELSAGQKQRVAIARAVVKKPSLILADEPTGNLDKEVGNLVLSFLKKVSSTCLVIIISHNQEDAYKYADRIIKLSEGKVIQDISTKEQNRNKVIIGNTIYLNDVKAINNDEFKIINSEIKRDKIQNIRPIEDLFSNTKETAKEENENEIKLSNNHLSKKNVNKLYKNFLFKNLKKTSFLSMASMILISLFSLCVMLINFNYSTLYASNNLPTTCVMKGVKTSEDEDYDSSIQEKITDEDEKIFEDCGDHYYIYNLGMYGIRTSDNYQTGGAITISWVLEYLYSKMVFGTAILDETQFKKVFDLDKVEYVAIADEYNPAGIYITDYMADSINYWRGDTYSDLTNQKPHYSCYINGIIKTNYKEKFAEIFDYAEQSKVYQTYKIDVKNDVINEYCDYIHNYYAVAYSFNTNYIDDLINSDVRNIFWGQGAYLELENYFTSLNEINNGFYTYSYCEGRNELNDIKDNEIIIPYSYAKRVIGSDMTADEVNEFFKDKTVKLNFLNSNRELLTYDVSVKVHTSYLDNWFAGKELTNKILKTSLYKCHINLFDKGFVSDLNNELSSHGMKVYGYASTIAKAMKQIISSYEDLFKFIAIILLIASVLFIFYMSYDSVKKKKYDIGVLKAIGMPIKDLYKVYGINIFFQFLICSVFYVFFILLFKYLANGILFNSILQSISITARYINFDIFTYTKLNLITDCSIILGASLIGALIPIIKIKNIKPIDIVRCKY